MRIAIAVSPNRRSTSFNRCYALVVYDLDDGGLRTSRCELHVAPKANAQGLVKWATRLGTQHLLANGMDPATKARFVAARVAVIDDVPEGSPAELLRLHLAQLKAVAATRPPHVTLRQRLQTLFRRRPEPA